MDPESPQSSQKYDPRSVCLIQPVHLQSSAHLGRYHSEGSPVKEKDCHSLVQDGYHFLKNNLKNKKGLTTV